ncbi:MAG TPA: SDR family NAD(P)-dependent oxidoreductase [Chitinophagaceae bacterium]
MRNQNFALITGASDGFGKALALECAARNINLVLVALPGSGLGNLCCYIERNFNVTTWYMEHDLSKKDECYTLFNEINRLQIPVNILINNAGIGGTHYFDERDAEFYYKQIELNVVSPTILTHLFIQNLLPNSPAYILNVSSLASFFYLPKKQVYGGTKSYLVAFSRSLRRELKNKGISVSVICPGGMNTNPQIVFQNLNTSGLSRWSIMDPDAVAKIAIEGMFKKKEMIIPGFWNKMFMLFDKLLPKWYKEMLTDRTMKESKTIRNPVVFSINPLKTAV